jgi:sirohydrochlorin ferrochelatase
MSSGRTLLVDNGSLNGAATLRLRILANQLSQSLGRKVDPVSVLHSDKVDPTIIDGIRAQTFENYAREAKAAGCDTLEVIPLFIGPSLALTEFLPELAHKVGIGLNITRTLWTPEECAGLVEILYDNLLSTGWKRWKGTVLLCDHGSPIPSVTAARDDLASQLRKRLELSSHELVACSMERREGPAYAFNEPLLADAIERTQGEVIVLMLFLLPGRHAGPGGDVAKICTQHAPSSISWKLSPLIGEHPGLTEVIRRGYTAC